MCWMRTMVANRLTDDGYSWTQIFSKFNSGTYNNQFHILDLKLIDTSKKVYHLVLYILLNNYLVHVMYKKSLMF